MQRHNIGPMMQQLGMFHLLDFNFDREAAYFKRQSSSLAQEWRDMWHGCATGQCDGNELDILWAPWIMMK